MDQPVDLEVECSQDGDRVACIVVYNGQRYGIGYIGQWNDPAVQMTVTQAIERSINRVVVPRFLLRIEQPPGQD